MAIVRLVQIFDAARNKAGFGHARRTFVTDSPGPGKVNYVVQLFRAALIVIGPDRKRLALASAISFLIGILETISLYLIATIAVAIASKNPIIVSHFGPLTLRTSIGSVLVVAGILVVALLAISFPLSTLLASLSSRAIIRIRERLLHAYLLSSLEYRHTHREGFLQQLIGEYSQRAETAVQHIATICVSACALSVVLVGAVVSSPRVASALLVGVAIGAIVAQPLVRRMRTGAAAAGAVNREIVSRVGQTARLSEEIATYNVGDRVATEFSGDIRQSAALLYRLRYEGRLLPRIYQYSTLAIVLLLITALLVVRPGQHPGLLPVVLILIRALTYGRQLMGAVQSGSELAHDIESIDNELKALDANQASRDGRSQARFAGISLDRVSFEYKPGHPVLRDVTFHVMPGQIVGIVGPSGSGKSTLSRILLRLRSPTSGIISSGGIPLSAISPAAWAGLSAFVPQENKLIFGTVADNIRFFRKGYERAHIEAAARAAHIHDELVELPLGYETMIGPGARGLSGGQGQRLAIARALLGNPQLLVLDEPTSALDQQSEMLIGKTLNELKGSVTIIIIAHRPATLNICDRILLVTNGYVTESSQSKITQ